MHRFTVKKSLVLFLLVAVGALFGFNLLQTESAAAAPAPAPAVPTPPQVFYLSSSGNVNVDGVKAKDEDILMFDPGAGPGQGTFTLYFDGSDVGVANTDVDAFEFYNDGLKDYILMSFDTPIKMVINGVPNTLVDDSDIVKFDPVATGPNTTGSFTSCFRGADFDLTTAGEDIDAITFDGTGRLVISTDGTAKVNGKSLVAADEDLLVLGNAPFTCNNGAGTWAILVDGSDLALTAASEDIGGAWIDRASAEKNIYLSTKGNFKAVDGVNAISGDSDDVFGFSPTQLGPNTVGFFFAVFDGDIEAFRKTIDGIFATPGLLVTSAGLQEVDVPVAVTQYEVLADDTDADDAELDDFDTSSETEEVFNDVMLPLVFSQ